MHLADTFIQSDLHCIQVFYHKIYNMVLLFYNSINTTKITLVVNKIFLNYFLFLDSSFMVDSGACH